MTCKLNQQAELKKIGIYTEYNFAKYSNIESNISIFAVINTY